ncbi:MAG: Ig-like domain-containing protein [Clostridia bacterium]|nr:Ig-like domain-containing protein [Clostridia bacterium]
MSCARAELPELSLAPLIALGEWIELDLGEGGTSQSLRIRSESTESVDLCVFPLQQDAEARLELTQNGALTASGDGVFAVAAATLQGDEEAQLRVSGRGRVAIEVSKQALSRCCDMPLEVEDGGHYDKRIALPEDDHWYAVRAETGGAAIIACAPEDEALSLYIRVFDETGVLVASSETLPSGAAVLSMPFEPAERYWLRVNAAENQVGGYRLRLLRSDETKAPNAIQLEQSELVLSGRSVEPLSISVEPEDACPLVFLDSSNAAAVTTGGNRSLEGREAGESVVTAYAYGGARAQCAVSVERVAVHSVRFGWDGLTMTAGETLAVSASIEPVNATERGIVYSSGNEAVVSVDAHGLLTAHQTGTAEIFAVSDDRGLMDRLTVTVQPAPKRYRALLIGEQTYMEGVEAQREGSVRSIEGVMSLLRSQSIYGASYQVTTLMDAPADAVLEGIAQTFAQAAEGDQSIIYITCHGFYQAGMTFFLMTDGSVLSAYDLASALQPLAGNFRVLADCCGSGGLIGGNADALSQGVTETFGGLFGSAPLGDSRVCVIASAMSNEDSYRIRLSSESDPEMSTVFARALCDGGGWSLSAGARSAMSADTDYDGIVTLDEMTAYLQKRAKWYLRIAGDYEQTVCAYPQHDARLLFARTD